MYKVYYIKLKKYKLFLFFKSICLTQQKRTKNLRKESFDLFFKNFIVLENQYKSFPNGKIYTKNLYELCRDPNLDFLLVREFSDYIWD